MNKEEFEFNIIFNLLKDDVVPNTKELKKRYPNINCSELRLELINYQIDKYGSQLDDTEFRINNRKERYNWYQRKNKRERRNFELYGKQKICDKK